MAIKVVIFFTKMVISTSSHQLVLYSFPLNLLILQRSSRRSLCRLAWNGGGSKSAEGPASVTLDRWIAAGASVLEVLAGCRG